MCVRRGRRRVLQRRRTGTAALSALAVIAARNEAGYIATTLRTLIEEGCEVVLLDHGSVDGTREIAESFLGAGLLRIVDVPWTGILDLAALLTAKQSVYESALHDWHMHADADEWPRAREDMPLEEFLMRRVDRRFSVVNYREFVFLPPSGVDMWGVDYRRLATRYYLFEPAPRRLMRAWRRGLVGSNVARAGHRLPVPREAISPEDLVLRHYIGLSWSHAIAKRANRVYATDAIARGWHRRRLDLRGARPVIDSPWLRVADPWDQRDLDDSAPTPFYFWEAGFYDEAPQL